MKQFVILMAMFFLGNVSIAQRPAGHPHQNKEHFDRKEKMSPKERMEKMISRLDENVGLTDTQKTKVQAIFEDVHEKIQKLEIKNKPEMEAMRSELQAARKNLKEDKEALQSKMRSIKEKYKGSLGEMKQEIHRIKAESKAKISEILTTEQKTKFFMMEDKRKNTQHRR